MYKTIGGHDLKFDWGTMLFIAEATGSDAGDPLSGIPQSLQLAAILYGGKARIDELKEMPTSTTFEDCKKALKTFSGNQLAQLMKAYNDFWFLDEEVSDQENKPEGAKTKKK